MRPRRVFTRALVLRNALLAGGLLLVGSANPAQPLDVIGHRTSHATPNAAPADSLYFNNRHIVTFRADLLGDSPADRAELARSALDSALQSAPRPAVTHSATPDSVRFEVGGRTVFFMVAADAGTPRPEAALVSATHDVQLRLEKAVREAAELRDHLRMASDILICLAASLAAGLLLRCTLWIRVCIARRLGAATSARAGTGTAARLMVIFAEHAQMACRLLANGITLLVAVLIMDTWITFVLLQFAWTRPWGEQSSTWLQEVMRHFASATVSAVPGLVVAGLIFLMARMVSRANAAFMQRVQRGDSTLGWLDAHTALPTHRLCEVVLWLFALSMAYPYLPGADTGAFKALSVMAGLMLSLGASSAVGQALSGLSLMYSRSLRVGQHVRIGDTEGTVVHLGMFATRLRTSAGDEVCLPNKLIFGLPIRHLPPEPPASTAEDTQPTEARIQPP